MKWIIAVVAVEALTEILLHSELLDKPRKYLMARGWFFESIFSCGYCMSVWVAAFVFGIFMLRWQIILVPIVIHRASNFLHYIYGWLKKNRWRA